MSEGSRAVYLDPSASPLCPGRVYYMCVCYFCDASSQYPVLLVGACVLSVCPGMVKM